MRQVRALAAGLALLGAVAGLPLLLILTVGNPMDSWAAIRAGDASNSAVLDVLAAVGYTAAAIAWAQFVVAVVLDVAHAFTRTPLPRARWVLGPQQRLARVLVCALFLVPTVGGVFGGSPALAATRPAAPIAAAAPSAPSTGVTAAAAVTADRRSVAPATSSTTSPDLVHSVYVVPARGGPSTYYDIAAAHLGDGMRWPQVWELNHGRVQADGAVMSSPTVLKTGWTVHLPAPAAGHELTSAGHEKAAGNPADLREVTVRPGDTLSQIAAAHGMTDWHEMWRLNEGRLQPDGKRFTDPDHIEPGWTLLLPPAAGHDATAPTNHPPKSQANPHHAQPTNTHRDHGPRYVEVAPTSDPSTSPRPAVASSTATTPPPPVAPPTTAAVPTQPTVAPARVSQPVRTPPTAPPAATVSASPDRTESSGAAHEAEHARASDTTPMVAFTGGGVVLAGLTLSGLLIARRRRFRHRSPGRSIAPTPAPLIATEKALLSAAAAGAADVTWLNQALRGLVHSLVNVPGGRLPEVVAARLTANTLELMLTTPADHAPAPWQPNAEGTSWTLHRQDHTHFDADRATEHNAPYPTLVSVGYTADGEHWLIDLERVAAMSLAGNPDRCLNLARFLAAELAHNVWSENLKVTLVGFGAEMAGLNPRRLRHTDDFTGAIAGLARTLTEARELTADSGVGVLEGRLRMEVGDGWPAHVMLIAPTLAADRAGLETLLDAMRADPARTAIALVLADDPDTARSTRWQLTIDAQGVLSVPELGVHLIAQQLPLDEAADLAALLALAADHDTEVPMPAAAGDEPWEAFSDAAGALRPELALSAVSPVGEMVVLPDVQVFDLETSRPWLDALLPLSTARYADITVGSSDTKANDVALLAPVVSPEVRQQVEDTCAGLDADLEALHDPNHPGAKLLVLDNPRFIAHGPAPEGRLPYYTEVVACLAHHRRGLTAAQLIQVMGLKSKDPDNPSLSTARNAVAVVRDWAAHNPATGTLYLPRAAAGRGAGVYRIEGLLVDAFVARQERTLGLARGAAGAANLQALLDLFTGTPFGSYEQRREEGYLWLVEAPDGVGWDVAYTTMGIDVGDTLARHYLETGRPELAFAAAQQTLKLGASDDRALLNLVAACDLMNRRAEAESYVKRIYANHNAEVPEDLPGRVGEQLRLRRRKMLTMP